MATPPNQRIKTLEEENSELRHQLDEALAQQTATAEVLQVINSSPGDLAPVFDAILDRAHAVCGATLGTLFLFDGDAFRAVATHGYPDEVAERLRRGLQLAENSTPAPLLTGARLIHRPDLMHVDDPVDRMVAARGGVRTSLLLPLRKDGALLGMISCNRKEVRPFSEKEIALLETFAAQAVIAMENARRITETREALDQQTATAEVLGVINSSPGDLAPVFDAILEKAHSLCGAAQGALVIYDGEHFRAVATRGLSEAYATLLHEPQGNAPGSANQRLLRGESLVHIPDVRAEESPLAHAAADEGIRTILFVPLRKDSAILGYITAYHQEVQPFTDKQIALLQNFAAQAVIAMENARLITETREALDQQTATAEVLQVINSSPGDLAPVFDAMLEKAMRLCGATLGHFMEYDGTRFRTTALCGASTAYAEFMRQPLEAGRTGGSLAAIVGGERFVHVPDMMASDAYRAGNPARRALVDLGGARTGLWVALSNDVGVLGVLVLYRPETRSFTDREIALLQNFAAQGVIAMENARLLGELRQRTEEVAGLNRDLEARVAAQVDELGRVGNLKRFLPPQVAEMVVSQGDERILESHRREIVVVFCDVRGYTAFSETAEPEEVIEFLGEYHAALGPLITRFEGTLSHFLGDGLMVFFNDPVPCPDAAERAVKMALAMREAAGGLVAAWRRRGHQMGFGAGIAQGYATLGQIGFADRSDYTAIGTVCNLAARLCGEAQDGQILVAQRVAAGLDGSIALEEVGALTLKGLSQPVVAFNVAESGSAASRLRLI